ERRGQRAGRACGSVAHDDVLLAANPPHLLARHGGQEFRVLLGRSRRISRRASGICSRLAVDPTSGSWLNLVERWFAALTEKQLRRGVHRSTRELEMAIRCYIDITNERPKPFQWTKTADEILASIARFCHRISNSGH